MTNLATREPTATGLSDPSIARLVDVRQLGDLTRFQTAVVVHPVHQYAIPRRVKQPDGTWETTKTVMLTSDGYDYLNRIMGVQIVQPETVVDEKGQVVPNPIHRKDYIYVRVFGIWRNDVGQLTSYREDVEVDFQHVYQDARMNAVWYDKVEGKKDQKRTAELELGYDKEGKQIYNDDGTPVYRLILPPAEELKALQKLSQLRTFGLRYAQTVAKTRILKTASGVRVLQLPTPQATTVAVVGWRDLLNPEQREAEARHTAEAVWGSSVTSGAGSSMSDVEMQAADLDVADPDLDKVVDVQPGEDSQVASADLDEDVGMPDIPDVKPKADEDLPPGWVSDSQGSKN